MMEKRSFGSRRFAVAVFAAVLVFGSLFVVRAAPPAAAFGSSEPLPLPSVVAGGYMTCGVRADNVAACWGENGVPSNDFADTHPGGSSTPPEGVKFLEVNPGYATGCGIKLDQTITCWGSGRYNKHFNIPSGTFRHVAPGRNYICALRTDGTIACWGGDAFDLNGSFVTNIPTGTFTQVSIGNRHACALRTNGTIACWGWSLSPGQAAAQGSNVDGQQNVPGPNTAGSYKYVNVSNFTSCAIKADDTPVCWGRNQGGQQTYPGGTFTRISTGFAHVCGLRPDTTITCWGRSAEGQVPAPTGFYTDVTAGTFHSCAMPASGPPAKCWGNNAAGRVQPIMSKIAPQGGFVGSAYSFQFTMNTSAPTPAAQAWLSPAPAYSVVDGSLPPGLALAPSGVLSGTPSADGSYTFKVAASNGLSPPDCTFAGGGDLPCVPGDPTSTATATRQHTIVVGAVAPATGAVSGQVTASNGGAPIAGATVAAKYSGGAPAGQATTDGSGNYSIAGLFPGTYNVTASGDGLQPSTQSATISEDATTALNFALGPLVKPTVRVVHVNTWQTVTDGLFVEWSEPFEQAMDPAVAHGYSIHAQSDCLDAPVATSFRNHWLAERQNSTAPLIATSLSRVRDMEFNNWQNVVPGNSYYLAVGANTEFGQTSTQRNDRVCVPFTAELRALDRSTVAGTVTSATGPVAGATVTLTRTLGQPGSVVATATTDANGAYSIPNVPISVFPNTANPVMAIGGHYNTPYNLTATAPGKVAKTSQAAATGNNSTTTVNVALKSHPVAVNDSYSTNEDTPLTVAAPGVLGNDSDADNDPITAAVATGPSNGTLALNGDGSFTYTPNANYNGSDSFTYTVNDGSGSQTATVSLTVNAVNDAPVAANDAYSATRNVALNVAAPGVLGNDSDVEADTLTAAVVTRPANGTLTLNPDGSFAYTPKSGFLGTDSFTYRATDSGGASSGPGTVTITVGTPTSASADLSVATADSPDPVAKGGTVTYTVTVANAGPSPATGVTLAASLKGGTLGVLTPSQGTCTNNAKTGVVTCSLGTIAAGGSATVTMTATAPNKVGTMTLTAKASSPTSDPNTANNTKAESTSIG